ncbi:MAG: GtrA family protein [Oscillospiraceae bacterium]|nr:GtrA family protein [Oscillospiraceae bacterium]
MKRILGLYRRYREIISYLVAGGLATVVALGSFWLFFSVIGLEENLSNILSDICATLFAYVTNKVYVFRSKCETWGRFFREMFSFFSARVFAVLFNMIVFWAVNRVCQSLIGLEQDLSAWIAKLAIQVTYIVLNYVLSKLFVFRKKNR